MHPYLPTIAGIALLLFLSARPGTGFILWLLLPLATVPRLIALIRAAGQPEKRKLWWRQSLMWFGATAVILVLHQWYARDCRTAADTAASQIAAYRHEHGRYPQISDIPPPPEQCQIRYIYFPESGKAPMLFYHSTWHVFDKYIYDFKQGSWRFFPD